MKGIKDTGGMTKENRQNNRDAYDIISYQCDLGDAVAFNYATIQSAYGNNAENRRRAFSVRVKRDEERDIKRKRGM